MTAAELMSQLNVDPEFLARKELEEAKIEQLSAACRDDEVGLVAELNELALNVESVWDLVNNAAHDFLKRNFTGSYENAYPVLVRHLKHEHHPRIREGIIRALSERNARGAAAAALLEELADESLQSHRWVIANALKTMLSKPEVENHPEIDRAYGKGYL